MKKNKKITLRLYLLSAYAIALAYIHGAATRLPYHPDYQIAIAYCAWIFATAIHCLYWLEIEELEATAADVYA